MRACHTSQRLLPHLVCARVRTRASGAASRPAAAAMMPAAVPNAAAGAHRLIRRRSLAHTSVRSADNVLRARAGGQRLVAAMEAVDALIGTFSDDLGRAVAHGARAAATSAAAALSRVADKRLPTAAVRAEVGRERDAALAMVDAARADVEQARAAARTHARSRLRCAGSV